MKVYCVFVDWGTMHSTPQLRRIFTLEENADKWKSEQEYKDYYFVEEWELEGSPWDMDIW